MNEQTITREQRVNNTLTVQDALRRAAERYDMIVDESTIRRACGKGYIKGAHQMGYTWFMSEAAFDEWLLNPTWQRAGRRVPKPLRERID